MRKEFIVNHVFWDSWDGFHENGSTVFCVYCQWHLSFELLSSIFSLGLGRMGVRAWARFVFAQEP